MSPTKNKHSNFLVQGSILAAASIIVRIIGILYRIPITNIIGVEGVGYYSNAFDIYNIVLILSSFSLPLSVSKLVAARNEKKEYRNSYRIFVGAMIFAVVSGTIATVVLFFGADFFASVVLGYPRSAIPMRVLAPTMLISAVMGVFRGYFQGKRTMVPTAISQILEQIVNAAVSVFAAYLLMKQHSASENIAAYGAAGSTLGTGIGAFTALLFLIFIFLIYKPIIRKQLRRDTTKYIESYRQIFAVLFMTIIPVILSQTVYNISGVIDNGLFGHIMAGKGVTQEVKSAYIGIYSGQYKLLTNVPIAIASAVAASLVPSIVTARVRGEMKEIKEKVYSSIHFNMIIAFPCTVGMAVLADPILQLLFPGSDAVAGNLLKFGSIAIVFFVLSTISNAVLQGINLMRIPVIHSAISLLLHVIIVFVLLQFFNLGVYALVIGNITFALMVCVLNWISISRHLNYKQEIKKSFAIPAISSLLMGVFTFAVYHGIHKMIKSNTMSTILSILLAVPVYGVTLLLLKGVDEEELYNFPMGRTMVRAAKKLRLL